MRPSLLPMALSLSLSYWLIGGARERRRQQQFSANASNIVKQAREVYMEPVASRLNSFWGLSGTTALSAADVEVFALYCSYLLAFEDAGAAQFCSIFEDEELVRWDYIQDLKLYYQYGYGFAPMVDAAFTILRDVYLTMENVIQRKSLERAKLYVGQHQTLLPLLALLVRHSPVQSDARTAYYMWLVH